MSESFSIDPEFRSLIPPLSDEERKLLERSIAADGCRDALTVWKEDRLLLDGHSRFDICRRRSIAYETREISLASRDAAKVWILRNQFGRRNLDVMTRTELALRLEELLAAQARKRQQAGKRADTPTQGVPPKLAEGGEVRDQVAKIAGISHGTFDKVKNIKEMAVPELIEEIKARKISIDAAEAVSELPREEQRAAVAAGKETLLAKAREVRGRRKAKAAKRAPLFARLERFDHAAERWEREWTDLVAELRDADRGADAVCFSAAEVMVERFRRCAGLGMELLRATH